MAIELRGTSGEDKGDAFVIEDWGGLNTQANRSAIEDNDFSALTNWFPIGKGNLRTTYAEGATLYTASGILTIIYQYQYNLAAVRYTAIFLSDGSAVQVRESDGATTTIGAANTFWSVFHDLPGCTQWQSKYLLICGNVTTNAYFVWNGSALFRSGSLSPDVTINDGGSAYASAPTVTAYGGSGSGATFSATVSNGSVTAVALVNPGSGYGQNDQISLGFAGGGSDNSAVAHAVISSSAGVSAALVQTGGTGYTSTSVGSFAGGGGAGAAAVISSAVNGVITGVTITNPGSGYTSVPTLSFTVGAGATFQIIITSGQVTITLDTGGSGYTGDPQVTISGDGSGAIATATVTAGAVSAITIVSPGTGYSFAAISITGGNRSANASASLMPFGVSGTTMETYQARVWIANGTTAQFTGPESVSEFSTAAGGGAYPATSSYLRNRIVRFFAIKGFLYQLGDSSVDVISNVQTSGNPATTTFNIENVDPQTGTPWRDSVSAFNGALVFVNPTGVYALYGGTAEKVSDALDGIFQQRNTAPSGFAPSSGVATFFSIRAYMMTLEIVSGSGTAVVLLGWTGKRWFVVTQLKTTAIISGEEIDSTLTCWGNDGTRLFPMFATPSTSLTKTLSTKLRGDPTPIFEKQMNMMMAAGNSNTVGTPAVLQVLVDNETAVSETLIPLTFSDNEFVQAIGTRAGQGGHYLGFTASTNAADFTLSSLTGVYDVVRTNA